MLQNLFWYLADGLLTTVAYAQQNGGNTGGTNNDGNPIRIDFFDPLKGMTLMDLVGHVLGALVALAIPVVTIMIIIGAYYLITSGGNPGRRKTGKDYILWAVVGFGVLLLADSAVAILQDFLAN